MQNCQLSLTLTVVYHDQLEIMQTVPLLMLFSGMQMHVCGGVLTCVGHSKYNYTNKMIFLCVNTKETNHLHDGHNARCKFVVHIWFYSRINATDNTTNTISLCCWCTKRGYLCIHCMTAPRGLLGKTGKVMFTHHNFNIDLRMRRFSHTDETKFPANQIY